MKKITFFLCFLFFLLAVPASAREILLPAGETVNHDFLAAAGEGDFLGTVNGDAFLAGGNLQISGPVNGDLLASGGQLSISSPISGNVRVIGGEICLSGPVGGNVTLFGGHLYLEPEASVAGRLVTLGGEIFIDGQVQNDWRFAGGKTTLTGQIGGDAQGSAGGLSLGPTAKIAGGLDYTSGELAVISNTAVVGGRVERRLPSSDSWLWQKNLNLPDFSFRSPRFQGFWHGLGLYLHVAGFFLCFAFGSLLLALFPHWFDRQLAILNSEPGLSLGLGLASPFLFSLVFVILILSLVGFPLAFLLLPLFLSLVYLAKIFSAVWFGEKVLHFAESKGNRYGALFLGLLLYSLLFLIRPVSFLLRFIFLSFGLGAFLLGFKRKPGRRLKKA